MSARAAALAERIRQASQNLLGLVEQLTETQWRVPCVAEGWPVAAVARHLAGGLGVQSGLIQRLADGKGLPRITMDAVSEQSAKNLPAFAAAAQAEVVEMIRANATAAVATVHGLTDEQLSRCTLIPWWETTLTTEQLIERWLIGHIDEHGPSIQAAVTSDEL